MMMLMTELKVLPLAKLTAPENHRPEHRGRIRHSPTIQLTVLV